MIVAVDKSDCDQDLQVEFIPQNSCDGRKCILASYLLTSTHIIWAYTLPYNTMSK